MSRFACILLSLLAFFPATLCAATDLLDDTAGITEDSVSSGIQSRQSPARPPAAAAAKTVKKPVVSSSADSTGELFEGGEESLFDDESAAAKKQKTEHKSDSTNNPGTGTASSSVADSAKRPGEHVADTGAAASREEIVQENKPAVKDSIPSRAAAAIKVEDVRSVNFARNLKDYRSPKLAMLLSLLLPGAGQAYAGNYVKTAIFGVLEAGIIGASVAYQVKGKNETNKAHQFADQHFSGEKFSAYYDSLRVFFRKTNQDPTLNSDSLAWARMNDIFYPTDGDTSFKSTFNSQVKSHSPDYYDNIQLQSIVQGWDDCRPRFGDIFPNNSAQAGTPITVTGPSGVAEIFWVHSVPDSAYLVSKGIPIDSGGVPAYGYSDNQITFGNWISTANGYYRTGFGILYLLLVNHIGSAIDAGITAKQHNDKLLGKQTFWQRVHFDPVCINSGSEMVAGYAVRVAF